MGLPKEEKAEKEPSRKTVMGLKVGIECNYGGSSGAFMTTAKVLDQQLPTALDSRYLLRPFPGNQSR